MDEPIIIVIVDGSAYQLHDASVAFGAFPPSAQDMRGDAIAFRAPPVMRPVSVEWSHRDGWASRLDDAALSALGMGSIPDDISKR